MRAVFLPSRLRRVTSKLFSKIFEKGIDFFVVVWYNIDTVRVATTAKEILTYGKTVD